MRNQKQWRQVLKFEQQETEITHGVLTDRAFRRIRLVVEIGGSSYHNGSEYQLRLGHEEKMWS